MRLPLFIFDLLDPCVAPSTLVDPPMVFPLVQRKWESPYILVIVLDGILPLSCFGEDGKENRSPLRFRLRAESVASVLCVAIQRLRRVVPFGSLSTS